MPSARSSKAGFGWSSPVRFHLGHNAIVLVLLRHGQSTWNPKNLSTGWADADLSDLGKKPPPNCLARVAA
jgi:hypothetical protein